MMKESNNNNFGNISYSPLDFNEMDVHISERVENNGDEGEDEFSTYFTDQKVSIPEADKVNEIQFNNIVDNSVFTQIEGQQKLSATISL